MGSNHRPSDYEPDELPLLYPATRIQYIKFLHIVKKYWTKNGVTERARTSDLFLRREAFFQLNYGYTNRYAQKKREERREKKEGLSRYFFFFIFYFFSNSYIHSGCSMSSLWFPSSSLISSRRSLVSANFFFISRSCARVSGIGWWDGGVKSRSDIDRGIIGIIFIWQVLLSNLFLLLPLKNSTKRQKQYLCVEQEAPIFYIK